MLKVNFFEGRKIDDSVKFEHSFGNLVIFLRQYILGEGPDIVELSRKIRYAKLFSCLGCMLRIIFFEGRKIDDSVKFEQSFVNSCKISLIIQG